MKGGFKWAIFSSNGEWWGDDILKLQPSAGNLSRATTVPRGQAVLEHTSQWQLADKLLQSTHLARVHHDDFVRDEVPVFDTVEACGSDTTEFIKTGRAWLMLEQRIGLHCLPNLHLQHTHLSIHKKEIFKSRSPLKNLKEWKKVQTTHVKGERRKLLFFLFFRYFGISIVSMCMNFFIWVIARFS